MAGRNQRQHIRFDHNLIHARNAGRRHHSRVRVQHVDTRDVVALPIRDASQRRHFCLHCKFWALDGEVPGRAYERPPV